MTKQWLDVIGIGEDGWAGLSEDARSALRKAEVVIGGNRHHNLAPELKAERVRWPEPFSRTANFISSYRGRQVAMLVTGDPLWYSAGAKIARQLSDGEIRFHPQLSAFQLACCRMQWSLADVETLTVHGRPVEQIIPWFAPHARLIVLTGGNADPGAIARLLDERGFGPSRIAVMAALGGPREEHLHGTAEEWAREDPEEQIPVFHTLCIECLPSAESVPLPRGPGLPDDAFETDGNFTKQDVRAVTVSALAPRNGEVLWDIGTGCGTVAVEWLRAARDAVAFGVDPNNSRLQLARRNSLKLGAPRLIPVNGKAPGALSDLPDPDAVFVGGGLGIELVDIVMSRMRPHGRLVANAVTLDSESLLADLYRIHGGELVRISVQRATRLGGTTGWRPYMPVTQWRWRH